MLRSLNPDILEADIPPGPSPWMLLMPEVSYTPNSKSDLPSLQLQLALEHLATVIFPITAPHRLYTDASLQADGAVFSPDQDVGFAVGSVNTPALHAVSVIC